MTVSPPESIPRKMSPAPSERSIEQTINSAARGDPFHVPSPVQRPQDAVDLSIGYHKRICLQGDWEGCPGVENQVD